MGRWLAHKRVILRGKYMKTEKEILEYLEKLKEYRKYLLANFAGDNEIYVVDAEITSLLWVLQ